MSEWISSLGSPWKACAVNVLFFIAAYSIGQLILSRFHQKNRLSNTILSIITGSNIMVLLFFLFSTTGACRFFPPFCFMAFCTIPFLLKLPGIFKNKIEIKYPKFRLNIILLLPLVLIFAGASLSLPIGWDEMVYHQSIVQRWLVDGFPAFYPDLPYSAFPASSSFTFWMLADAGTVIAPRLFIWCCWFLTLLTFCQILNLHKLTRLKTMIIVIAFALSKTMLFVVSDAYAEIVILLNTAGILLVISDVFYDNSPTSPSAYRKTAVLCGIMAGGAASIKLTGMVLFAIPLLWFVFSKYTEKSNRKKLTLAAILLGVGSLIAIPFYFRPLMATGNPFYPYFCDYFSSSSAQIAMSHFHHQIASAGFGHKSLPMFFAAPFALAFSTETFDGNYGWQFLSIVILAVIAAITAKERKVYLLSSASIILYIFWFFTAQQARFFLPGIFIIYISAGVYISGMKKLWQNAISGIILLLTLASLPWDDSGYYYFSWSQLAGCTKKVEYLHIGTGKNYLPAVDAVIKLTPENSRLMVIFEHRILYFPRKTIIATPYFQEKYFTPIEHYTTIAALEKELKKSKADYMLIAMNSASPDKLPEYLNKQKQFSKSLSSLIPKGKLREIWRSKNYSLFKIRK